MLVGEESLLWTVKRWLEPIKIFGVTGRSISMSLLELVNTPMSFTEVKIVVMAKLAGQSMV